MANHFTIEERRVLYQLNKRGTPKDEMARLLGRNRSTIYRELVRNKGGRGYRPRQAQRLADERRLRCRRPRKMSDASMRVFVTEGLKKFWSPDQIAGRTRRDFPAEPARQISDQTIYNWIADERAAGCDWRKFLRRRGRRPGRTKRGQLIGCVSVEGRPKVVDQRRRFGDWEGDTVVGKGRRNGLLTAVERKSGYLRVAKVSDRQARTIVVAARRAMGDLPESLRRTMTLDNGKEFAQHDRLAQNLGLKVYFAKPYCAWQRGTNENTNGLLRQFVPKGTDFTRVSHQAVARMERQLNERPRRRLDYRTPAEVLASKLRRN
jgi:IS30 family transposase